MLPAPFLMRFLSLLLALVFSPPLSVQAASDSSPAWKDAMIAYTAKDWPTAIERFKKIAEDEKEISAALCHNIGNCEYKLADSLPEKDNADEIRAHQAAASMWYRRALALDPWLPEARQNLRFLKGRLGFLAFEDHRVLARFANWFSRKAWVAACQAGIWICVVMIVWLVWATPKPGRRWPLVTLLSVAVVLIGTATCGLIGKSMKAAPLSKRLLTMRELPARSAPAEAAAALITLYPGAELLPIREEGYWTYCEVPVGDKEKPLRGWLRTSTLENLWPWNPQLVD